MQTNKLDKILKVATELIGSNGYAGTSMQDIADKVGLHKSTLFHYVKSKEELLLLILERTGEINQTNLENIVSLPRVEPEEKLRKAILNHLRSITEDLRGANIYFNETKVLPKSQRARYRDKQKAYQLQFQKIVSDMKRKGFFEDVDEKVATFSILGMLNSVNRWFKRQCPLRIEEVSEMIWRMIVKEPTPQPPKINT
jgi:TetR/AcrR family transcriptional regulator, cholesterol catabolism regulator